MNLSEYICPFFISKNRRDNFSLQYKTKMEKAFSPLVEATNASVKISVIKQCMQNNIEFIQHETNKLHKLKGEIQQRVEENDKLSYFYIKRASIQETRTKDLENETEEVRIETTNIRLDNISFKEEVEEAWKNIRQRRMLLDKPNL